MHNIKVKPKTELIKAADGTDLHITKSQFDFLAVFIL